MTMFTFTNNPYTGEIPLPSVSDNNGPPALSLRIDFSNTLVNFDKDNLEPTEYTLSPGWHYFSYTATDEQGNAAECNFQIEREGMYLCRTLRVLT